MAYVCEESRLGVQPMAVSSTVQNHPVGAIISAYDPNYGDGEFIYLPGVASTIVGSVVTWAGLTGNYPSYQTALAPSTANLGQPLAVAMSANVAGQYGWYQITGTAVVSENATFVANAPVFLAGAGQLTTAVAAGKQMLNARSVAADGTPSAGLGLVEMERPFAEGQIT